MSSNTPHVELIYAAFELSVAAPEHWKRFEAAFAAYVQGEVTRSVQVSPEQAQTSIGRAQSLLALQRTFAELYERRQDLHKVNEARAARSRTR